MDKTQLTINLLLLLPVTVAILYYDVRYRRIPNIIVLGTLLCGLIVNTAMGGWSGFLSSIAGCAIAFIPMFFLHAFGAMGAGDVKLFASIGSVVGLKLVLPTFVIVALVGGLLALYTMVRAGSVRTTMYGVFRLVVGLLPGWEMPRFSMPPDRRHTIPYGVAITVGSIVSLLIFRDW